MTTGFTHPSSIHSGFVQCHTQPDWGQSWLTQLRGVPPLFVLVLGFTETGLIPGISAAGATPEDRRWTALADAEFMVRGPQPNAQFPLPPLQAGASPTLISRAVLTAQRIPSVLLNAGLPQAPTVLCVDLGGVPGQSLAGGKALPLTTVNHLWQQGMDWGHRLARQYPNRYLIVGECVVGGTTTALGLLLGLGWDADGRVNSSHPVCNHAQKRALVEAGLGRWRQQGGSATGDPLELVAAIGDPMQPVVAGLVLAASQSRSVLLAGGTQMLAVYALMKRLAAYHLLAWRPEQVAVGTTPWVTGDPTGDTVGLAEQVGACLLASRMSFANSPYPQLRAYEQGFVKEGVGAGGCAIAAHLYGGWENTQLVKAVEDLLEAQLLITARDFSKGTDPEDTD